MKETCKECGKRTKYMYRLNGGLFCEKHYQFVLHLQKSEISMEEIKERLNLK